MHLRLSFENAIDEELVAEVEKGVVYASSRLQRFRITPDRRAADLECSEGAADEVCEKVRRYVDAFVARSRDLGVPEELARTVRRDDGPVSSDAFAELERRGWARSLGRGQVGLAGGALALRRFVDDAVRERATSTFAAVEEDYPALLDPEVLSRCGYLGSFPQSVCLVAHLTEDFDGIEAFRRANTESAALQVPDASAMTYSDAVLRPAICLGTYRAHEGTTLPEGGLAITTAGRAFRYESRNLAGLQRLWDFSMREIVFLGSTDDVEKQRAGIVHVMTSLMNEWDLASKLVSATDPFFATVRGTKALWQRTRSLKYEMLVDVGTNVIAAGSINFAGTLFGEAFRIRTAQGPADGAEPGDVATTACVGFGLERLVLALFSQHGFDAGRWPVGMREVVFG